MNKRKSERAGTCLFILLSFVAFAQEHNELINSADLIDKAVKLNDEGKDSDAVELFKKVPSNDTNYYTALSEMALSYMAWKKDSIAVALCKKVIKESTVVDPAVYVTYGSSLDDAEKREEALGVFNEGLALFKNSYSLYFNKGIVELRMNKKTEAMRSFKKALVLNPYHASSYLRIGSLYLEQNKLVEALQSLEMFLLMEPGTSRSYEVITLLEKSLRGDDVAENIDLTGASGEDNFSELEVILRSKVALNKKYKSQVKLNYDFVKQTQVFLEKLKFNPNDQGYVMQNYVPFYTEMYKKGYFEPFIYYILSSVSNEQINKWKAKHKKEIEEFTQWATNFITDKRTNRMDSLNGEKRIVSHWYYSNASLKSIGNLKGDKNIGYWEFYYKGGKLSSRGNFDELGNRQGKWEYFYDNGQLKELYPYMDNELNGNVKTYYRSGLLESDQNFVQGKNAGTGKYYEKTGYLKFVAHYTDGKKDSILNGYYSDGSKLYEISEAADQYDGLFKEFYSNGRPKTLVNFVNGKQDGESKTYYRNGVLSSEGKMADGKEIGDWKFYYHNGKLKKTGSYAEKAMATGVWTTYYKNGKVEEESPFEKDELNGDVKSYDKDGIIYSVTSYKHGKITGYTYSDKKGKILAEEKNLGSNYTIKTFLPDGTKNAEVNYVNSKREWESRFYDVHGILKVKENYRNGLLNGIKTTYYPNGNLKSSINYTDGKEDGYYKGYFSNKTLEKEGWYTNGKAEGFWFFYNPKGTLVAENYYHLDQLQGDKKDYSENGRPDNISVYDDGLFTGKVICDTLGKEYERIELLNGSGKYNSHFMNGLSSVSMNFKFAEADGYKKAFNPNGKLSYEGSFKFDKKAGIHTWYFNDGNEQSEYSYEDDELEGPYKTFYENGKTEKEGTYEEGKMEGAFRLYYDNGVLMREGNYEDGETAGEWRDYNEDGTLVSIRYYQDGTLLSYSYHDRTGTAVKPIELVNESGKLLAYYPNGNKSIEKLYKFGELTGDRIEYYPDGQLKRTVRFTDNNFEGLMKTYFPGSAKIKSEENFFYDKKDGASVFYFENGKKQREEFYIDGEAFGDWTYYDLNGKLIRIERYYGDKRYQ